MNTKTEVLHRCVLDAFAGRMTFLETIQQMAAVGVRWYSANLLNGKKTHYLEDGTIHEETWPDWVPAAKNVPLAKGAWWRRSGPSK